MPYILGALYSRCPLFSVLSILLVAPTTFYTHHSWHTLILRSSAPDTQSSWHPLRLAVASPTELVPRAMRGKTGTNHASGKYQAIGMPKSYALDPTLFAATPSAPPMQHQHNTKTPAQHQDTTMTRPRSHQHATEPSRQHYLLPPLARRRCKISATSRHRHDLTNRPSGHRAIGPSGHRANTIRYHP
jgi:hypothetical protein